ncbi:MAG: hypothetical protein AB7N76_14855 [Planctomycetota bacterium]
MFAYAWLLWGFPAARELVASHRLALFPVLALLWVIGGSPAPDAETLRSLKA